MAPTYAGILGPLAFCVVIARGVITGESAASVVKLASCSLFGFALIGWIAGWIAARLVAQSVQDRMKDQLAAIKESAKESLEAQTQKSPEE